RCVAWTSPSPRPPRPTRKPAPCSRPSASRSATDRTRHMAKTSMINREAKRAKLAKKYAAKREALKKIVGSETASYEEKMDAAVKLQKLPRDSSPSRQTTRCALTGRPRAVYSKFGLGRNMLRKATMNGDVPGLRKASW